jgi:hypothetical protein
MDKVYSTHARYQNGSIQADEASNHAALLGSKMKVSLAGLRSLYKIIITAHTGK